MLVLGLSGFYHDSAACLLRDGRIVAAAQEERFTRIKHDASFPAQAAAYCLRAGGVEVSDLDAVAFYDKPLLTFERLLETYVGSAPRGLISWWAAMPIWLKRKLWTSDRIRRALEWDGPLFFPEHHESHAASAFFASPFEHAAVLTTDGVGEWATTTVGVGEGATLRLLREIHFPHSLGLLYSALTYFCGFRVNSGEYKLMGLAPYGSPRFAQTIRDELIDLRPDGSFRLNMDYFGYATGLRMTTRKMERLFGPRRAPESALTPRDLDLAASIQAVTTDAVQALAREAVRAAGSRDLTMAGGVALNCVANGHLLRSGALRNLWVQPAAGDAGGALGAALAAYHHALGGARSTPTGDLMQGGFLGPSFSDDEIEAFLSAQDVPYTRAQSDADLAERTADLLASGSAVGWFHGRMEYGPRALGGRSILADPRGRDVQRTVNLKVKFRESFRPFAPSVTAERASDFFDLDAPSPYMLLVAPVRGATSEGIGLDQLGRVGGPLPAVTHVDGSARVQTVDARTNPLYHALLRAFEQRTGVPILVNTSFNVRGEPIVATPADAYRCFRATHLDALVMGRFVLEKRHIPGAERETLTPDQVAETYGLD
jgi:carbamoyltransferase